MHALTTSLQYKHWTIPALMKDGEKWVGAVAMTAPLGLADRYAVTRIMRRNRRYFPPLHAQKMKVRTPGGPQEMWMLSRAGAEMLAILCDTDAGRDAHYEFFRNPQAWRVGGADLDRVQRSPSIEPLYRQTQRMLDFLQAHAKPGNELLDMIRDIRRGSIQLPRDPMLERPIAMAKQARVLRSEATRLRAHAEDLAGEIGYTGYQFSEEVQYALRAAAIAADPGQMVLEWPEMSALIEARDDTERADA